MARIMVMHFGGDQVRGSEICLIQTIEALTTEGYDVLLLRNNAVVDQALTHISNITIKDFNYPEIMFEGRDRRLPLSRYIKAVYALYKIIRKDKVDLIFCNSGLPCQTAVVAGRLAHKQVVCHFHHPAPKRYLYLWLVKFCDQLIFPSKFTASLVQNKCGKNGEVIYNAVDLENRFVPAILRDQRYHNDYELPRDAVVISQVGALVKHKRADFLLQAFSDIAKEAPNAYLILVGKGPQQAELKQQAQALGIAERVRFPGYIPDVAEFLKFTVDINVLASCDEGLGISVIEASGCALPSVTTDCTGLSEVVWHEETGFKFAMDDRASLSQHLKTLINNPQLRTRLGHNARRKALEFFHAEQYQLTMRQQVRGVLQIA